MEILVCTLFYEVLSKHIILEKSQDYLPLSLTFSKGQLPDLVCITLEMFLLHLW